MSLFDSTRILCTPSVLYPAFTQHSCLRGQLCHCQFLWQSAWAGLSYFSATHYDPMQFWLDPLYHFSILILRCVSTVSTCHLFSQKTKYIIVYCVFTVSTIFETSYRVITVSTIFVLSVLHRVITVSTGRVFTVSTFCFSTSHRVFTVSTAVSGCVFVLCHYYSYYKSGRYKLLL